MGRHNMAKAAPWIIAGVALDLLGAVLIVTSLHELPDIRPALMAGVAALVVGAVLVSVGVIRRTQSAAQAGVVPGPPSGSGWRPEPELVQPLPRSVALSRSGRRIVLLWALLTVAVPCYVILAASRSRTPDASHVAESFLESSGEIHDKEVRGGGPNGPSYYLYYSFASDWGNVYRGSLQVKKEAYDSLKVGDPVTVRFFPENPTVHEVAGFETKPGPPPVIPFAAGFTALMVAIFEIVRRRHRNLTARGVSTAGLIESSRRRGAGAVYVLSYSVNGQIRKLRGTEHELNLSEGDSLTVLYDPGKPQKALIYRLSMYQAVAE